MKPSRYLAFDLGAGSGRGVLGELRDGKLSIREICRFPNGMIDVLGHLHWNIFGLFEHIKDGLRLCAQEPGDPPESIGIDTWGVDFGLLASDGSVLGLPYGYRDSRTDGAMDSFFKKISRDRVYELTGIQFLPFNSLFQLEAMVRDKSPLLDVASDLLFIPDLLHYLLTGIKKTEFSFATTSQVYNPVKSDWEDQLLSALGIPKTLMQEIIQPGTTLGVITPEIARETGFPPTPLVAVVTHDTGSAVAAVPVAPVTAASVAAAPIPGEGEGWAYISSGTWSLMGVEVKNPVITKQALDLNFTNEGGVEGTFRLLKNIAGLWLLQECRRIWAKDKAYSHEELMEAAESARPLETIIDPDWNGFLNPPDMPEAICQYCHETGQSAPDSPAGFVRCILESLALKYRFVLDQLRKICPRPINRIHVIGGGALNRVLCRFTANATGLQVLAGPAEATAIGNIMVQALAAGRVGSLAGMREVIRRSFEPVKYEPDQTDQWRHAYERFCEITADKN